MKGEPFYQLVILKPTAVFYAYLISALPKETLPPYDYLKVDMTAFLMPYFKSDEQTLNFIEAHFSKLFSYEIQRWLGRAAENEISSRWDDFVSSFFLSFHSNVYATSDKPFTTTRAALIAHPKSTLLKALYHHLNIQKSHTNYQYMDENGTAMLLPYDDLEELYDFCQARFHVFADLEKQRLAVSQFPEIGSYQTFTHYFKLSVHQHVLNLTSVAREH